MATNTTVRLRKLRGIRWLLPLIFTLGALPILTPVWIFNGALSVEGLPLLWHLLLGAPPQWARDTFFVGGWAIVVASSVIEIIAAWYTLRRRELPPALFGVLVFFVPYDLITTWLGLAARWLPSNAIMWVAVLVATAVVTCAVETVLSLFWKEV